jgi:thioredoxin 1
MNLHEDIERIKEMMGLLTEDQNQMQVTDTNISEIIKIKNKLVIIDFSAVWCGPCQRMKKHFDELLVDPKYKDKFILGTHELKDFDTPLAKKYNIQTIPYVMLFRNGTKVFKFNRYQDKPYLIDLINKYKF